ncbi:hypothetical protein FF2_043884 [Malus domestica]
MQSFLTNITTQPKRHTKGRRTLEGTLRSKFCPRRPRRFYIRATCPRRLRSKLSTTSCCAFTPSLDNITEQPNDAPKAVEQTLAAPTPSMEISSIYMSTVHPTTKAREQP